ncbi:MAG: hypothetical protein OEY05_01005 [Paracoccaceae bacterium]|nr:hypothetical protein [Paracoccaceae bacterium]
MKPFAAAITGLILAFATQAWGQGDQICGQNASDTEHLFAIETADGTRWVGMLAPGQTHCLPSPVSAQGMVSAYEDPEGFEGCSRLTTPGKPERLLRYVSFDRCAWGSNS